MTDTNTNKLFPATEVIGSILIQNLSDSDIQTFVTDPKNAIMSSLNIDFSDLDVNVVENNSNEINIVLPFYKDVDTIHAEMLKDEKLADISGGEIAISLGFFFGAIGVACGIGGVVGGVFTTGAIIGGVAITAGVAATAVVAVGGVAGTAAIIADGESGGK